VRTTRGGDAAGRFKMHDHCRSLMAAQSTAWRMILNQGKGDLGHPHQRFGHGQAFGFGNRH
jgi:hypothetical protein